MSYPRDAFFFTKFIDSHFIQFIVKKQKIVYNEKNIERKKNDCIERMIAEFDQKFECKLIPSIIF